MAPYSNECYMCFDTRRGNFGAMHLKDLKEETSPPLIHPGSQEHVAGGTTSTWTTSTAVQAKQFPLFNRAWDPQEINELLRGRAQDLS